MAREPRITIPTYPHHIIQRGNNRQAIFLQKTMSRVEDQGSGVGENPASHATGPTDWEGSISERDRSDDGTTFHRGVTRKTKKGGIGHQ